MEGTDDMNMNISTDSEINVRLIDLSRIVSSMLETAETPSDIAFLRDELGANADASAAVGIKPMTEKGSKRLVRELARGKARIGPT